MFSRMFPVIVIVGLAALCSPAFAQLSNPIPDTINPGSLTLRIVDWVQVPNSSGSSARINLAVPSPDGSGRVFVNDQRGYIHVIQNDVISEYFNAYGVLTNAIPTSFYGVGLTSLAFHPDFANNGIFYTVHMEQPNTGTADFIQTEHLNVFLHSIITQWTAQDPTANTFSGTHVEFLRVEAPTYHHAIQQLAFNPVAMAGHSDYGMLYVGHGDGDELPTARAQTLNSLHGSILRLDTYGNDSSNGRYGIPIDNPFANDLDPNTLGEIWAHGFRNPHRISWDTLTGIMFTGDIGEHQIEEINIVEAGGNYGWNQREGTFLFNQSNNSVVYPLPGNDSDFGYSYPVLQYDHDDGIAIMGGYVYRGSQIAELYGQYLFGDLVTGRMFYAAADDFVQGQQSTAQQLNLLNASDVAVTMSGLVGSSRVDLKFGFDHNNELLILSKADGKIRRLESTLPQLDADGDGVSDSIDNCQLVANADQQDSNNDGFGNICDQDVNNSCNVDFVDFGLMINTGVLFSTPATPGWNADFDFNSDGVFNFLDIGSFGAVGVLFSPPGPGTNDCTVGE